MVPLSFGCGCVVLAAIAMLAPSRAARSAMASPMPRLAPEMNSVLPLRDVISEPPGVGTLRALQLAARGSHQARRFLSLRVQYPSARFRQRESCKEKQAIGRDREDRDRVGKCCRVRQRADQKRKQRADAAAEIIAEALTRAAQ